MTAFKLDISTGLFAIASSLFIKRNQISPLEVNCKSFGSVSAAKLPGTSGTSRNFGNSSNFKELQQLPGVIFKRKLSSKFNQTIKSFDSSMLAESILKIKL